MDRLRESLQVVEVEEIDENNTPEYSEVRNVARQQTLYLYPSHGKCGTECFISR